MESVAAGVSPSEQGRSANPWNWEYILRKYLLLLATVVSTVTYAAGLKPPGGSWPDTHRNAGHLLILRDTSYARYLVFFYCNATAFAASLVLIVLTLILALLHEQQPGQTPGNGRTKAKRMPLHCLRTLRAVMVLGLLSLMAAFAAGACRDKLTSIYSAVLVAAFVIYLAVHVVTASVDEPDRVIQQRRKVLMLLATFAVSVTYVAGLSGPGGFWDHDEGRHHAGDGILKGGRHEPRFKAFFVCNNTAFVTSLFIIVLLLGKKLRHTNMLPFGEFYWFILLALISLVGAYAAAGCRETGNTIYVSIAGVIFAFILIQLAIVKHFYPDQPKEETHPEQRTRNATGSHEQHKTQGLGKARSLVLLLATLAATVTYQAGLDPPGGIWLGTGNGHTAGDPVLLTSHPRRYKAFFYCNSVAFVASLVAIVMAWSRILLKHHALEAAMIIDLFGLIGAYASGSCRDLSTSIYVTAMAGCVLVYVVIHIIFFTLDVEDNKEPDELIEKRRKRLLLFAILGATMTYQAGLTPPVISGLEDDESRARHHGANRALDYYAKAFFYCNSVSFMMSMSIIILLVNPNLYKPAIRSNALSVCTAAATFSLMGAYATGSMQHLKISIYIFVLVSVVMCSVVFLVWVSREEKALTRVKNSNTVDSDEENNMGDNNGVEENENKWHSRRKYLTLLGILVASVTYQAGLEPPGKLWQDDGSGHTAGEPVMLNNRRHRYMAFFYSNSTSFVASIVVIVLLLPEPLQNNWWWLKVMNTTMMLDLLGLLVAYAVGSSRSWTTSEYVSALIVAVLAYFAVHVMLSRFCNCKRRNPAAASASQSNQGGNCGH